MHTIARVEIPRSVRSELEGAVGVVDSAIDFFRRRLFTTTNATVVLAFILAAVFITGAALREGPDAAMRAAIVFFVGWSAATLFAVVATYPGVARDLAEAKKRGKVAIRDLEAGYGEHNALELARPPRFFEHDYGILVLADAGFCETLYFDIAKSDHDPRWQLYLDGALYQRSWRWLRLARSKAIVDFIAAGARLSSRDPVYFVDAPDAWEAVAQVLGQPRDGEIIRLTFDDAVFNVERAL